ncbi:MAG: hypothetical protein HYZ65_04960 [Burkholderiales bacterium]|nr:hypothetical protein [Burkholderiales bacterium]
MNATKSNPVLEFVLNAADAVRYVWQRYTAAIAQMSWKKLLLASLLALFAGSILQLHGIVQLVVLASLVLKCVLPKADLSATDNSPSEPEQ